jgi:PhzF family phenazine biosynthesis protein
MSQPVVVVDAFTDKPFSGNPAGVCLMDSERDPQWMQNVAREMNLSETAFAYPVDGGFSLRWFTPAVEVDLCGHATLATAHVLWESGQLRDEADAVFRTRSGNLTCRRRDGWIEMDFPALDVTPANLADGLLEALGAPARFAGRSRMDAFVELESESALRAMRPDIAGLSRTEARGIIVTARASTPGYDFVSRFFAPRAGVDEDPVTGSAHCALAPYWSEKLNKRQMVGYQASLRGGIVRVETLGDRVLLMGQAVTMLRGELLR